MRNSKDQFIENTHSSPDTEFKKGHTIQSPKFKKGEGHWKGKKFSKEHCANMGKSRIGKPGFWKGKKRDPEMYKKIVEKKRNNGSFNVSQETRDKLREANKDRKGSKNPNWKGGERINQRGYFEIYMPDHPYSRAHGYIKRSRLVMENHLGRYLTKEEVIHHINYNKIDDSIGNLMLFKNHSEHLGYHNKLRSFKAFAYDI